MFDRAASALREALGRLRGDAYPDDLLAHGRRTLAQATLDHLGLREQPFSDHTAPEHLFVDDAIRMQINMLAEHLRSGEVLPVLKGEPGSGRTSVLIRLMTEHAEAMHFFIARGGRRINARRIVVDMLRMLVRPVPDDPGACYRDLAQRLRALTADGKPAVLVIDDADQMPDGELDNLLALHDGLRRVLRGRFRTLLTAEPAIEMRLSGLESEQIGTGQLVTTDIRPITRGRVAPYLEHRLRTAGLGTPSPFADGDLDRIHAAAGGLPRDVEIAAAADLDARFGPQA